MLPLFTHLQTSTTITTAAVARITAIIPPATPHMPCPALLGSLLSGIAEPKIKIKLFSENFLAEKLVKIIWEGGNVVTIIAVTYIKCWGVKCFIGEKLAQ